MQDVRKVQLLLFKSLQNWGRRVSVGKVYHRRIEKTHSCPYVMALFVSQAGQVSDYAV